MEFSMLFAVLPEIRNWFALLRDRRAEVAKVDEREEAAVAALYIALNETQIYVGSMRRNEAKARGVIRDYETEANLSRLWNDAARKLRNYDPDMSQRLRVKAEYWANPDKWSESDVEEARIQITQVLDSARTLLHGEVEEKKNLQTSD